jgi:hypothetical protein
MRLCLCSPDKGLIFIRAPNQIGYEEADLVKSHICDPDVGLVVHGETVGHVEQVCAQAGLHLYTEDHFSTDLQYLTLLTQTVKTLDTKKICPSFTLGNFNVNQESCL